MRLAMILAVGLAGCCVREPVPQPTFPKTAAATVYVFESYEGWLGDSPLILNSFPSKVRAHWIGEAALSEFLKWVVSTGKGNLLGHARFLLVDGEPSECFLPDPDPQVAWDVVGRVPRLQVGFHFITTPYFSPGSESVKLNYRLEHTSPPAKATPPEPVFGVGEPRRLHEMIDMSIQTIPVGAALVISHPKGSGRIYVTLLHIGSTPSK